MNEKPFLVLRLAGGVCDGVERKRAEKKKKFDVLLKVIASKFIKLQLQERTHTASRLCSVYFGYLFSLEDAQ
jgi:hypothetical protein